MTKLKELCPNTTISINVNLCPPSKIMTFSKDQPYYETYIDPLTPYSSKFPRASTYSTQQTIVEAFPHLENVNDSNFDVESISPNAQFYILRSGNDDNIHKVRVPFTFQSFLFSIGY